VIDGSRPLRDDADWWAVRRLLVGLFPLVPHGSVWDIRRWDGQRFHDDDPGSPTEVGPCRLWFAGGDLVGAAHSEGDPSLHLQVHPDHRHLEGEMIDWGMEELAEESGGVRRLLHDAYEDDLHRADLLEARGFQRQEGRVVNRRRDLAEPIAVSPQPPGYLIRETTDDPGDCTRMAELLNAAFGRTFHTTAEYRGFIRNSPSFRHHLNLVAEARDGTFAAHVGFTLDEENRCGIVEPVCTHPGHRKRGLALALLLEGLRRLQHLGAVVATVETGGAEGPNRLYQAAGFTAARWGRVWEWKRR